MVEDDCFDTGSCGLFKTRQHQTRIEPGLQTFIGGRP